MLICSRETWLGASFTRSAIRITKHGGSWVCLAYDLAQFRERLHAPVPKDLLVDECTGRKPTRRYTALRPRNAKDGSITLHHHQYPATVRFKTASTTERNPNTQNPVP